MEASGSVEETQIEAPSTKGTYLVLAQDGSGGWVEVPNAATIREAFEKHGEGVYVRVPRRSWKPQTVKVEKVDRVKIT